jgi:hypothetical protein
MNKILVAINSFLLLIIFILCARFETITYEQKYQILDLEWDVSNLKFRLNNCEKSLGDQLKLFNSYKLNRLKEKK